jgi:hypothetical protein
MEAILHIGTNKTGTSAIQHFLYQHTDFLAEHGFVYPKTGRGDSPAHHPLAEILAEDPDLAPQLGEQLQREAQGQRGIILSSEAFRTHPPEAVAAMLSGFDTKVVVFLRPHLPHLSSWYREGIKSRNYWTPFSEFIASNGRPYFPWLQNFSNAFGHEAMSVTRYDRREFSQHSVVQEFFSKFAYPQFFPELVPEPEQNPSISGNLLYIKRQINQFLTLDQAHDLIPEVLELATLDPTFLGPMAIPDDICSRINRFAELDVQKIEEAYGINLAPSPSAHLGHLTPDLDLLAYHRRLLLEEAQARKFTIAEYISSYSE